MSEKQISRKENLKKCTSLEKQKGTIGETYIVALLSSAIFRLQNRVSDFFQCFAREIKRVYQSSLGNEVDLMNVSLNILAKT